MATVTNNTVNTPAMVGVSVGLGENFGPSAAIAANSAASIKRPRLRLTRPVAPGLIPATNTRKAMQKATVATIDITKMRMTRPPSGLTAAEPTVADKESKSCGYHQS
jgi:hypothetical protein